MRKEPKVALVGAGPGDPDLLTMKAHRLLTQADVVVYDRLVSTAVLNLVPKGATRVFAGKAAKHHHMPQDEINALLVTLAEAGHRVVRLKGGDPFVFGRGSEEAEHLAAHGIAFEIVPGISAAAGCAAYAGIPLTHRSLARSVRFITGHCKADEELVLDWQGLADADTTLVIYMGLANCEKICAELIAHGRDTATPAAAIHKGTTPDQRNLFTTLGDLPGAIEREGFVAPTLMVIGTVVGLADVLRWHDPLAADAFKAHG